MSLPMGGRCHTENIYGATIPHHFLRESKQHVQVGVLWTFPIFRFCFKFDGGWGKRNLKGDWGQREEGSIVEAKKKKMCLWTTSFHHCFSLPTAFTDGTFTPREET